MPKNVFILPHEARALLELFCLQPIIFGWRQNSSSSAFTLWGKTKISRFAWADKLRSGSDEWFSKILRITTGSDSILSDQNWTWTAKFHSPLISGVRFLFESSFWISLSSWKITILQKWMDCEIFQSEYNLDPWIYIESSPDPQFFLNHEFDPVLICPCKNMYFVLPHEAKYTQPSGISKI